MHAKRRFQRFDPVTVRAAARLVRYARCQRLSASAVETYLRELALLQPLSSPDAHLALERLARRAAALGRLGVSTPFSKSRVQLTQLPRHISQDGELVRADSGDPRRELRN